MKICTERKTGGLLSPDDENIQNVDYLRIDIGDSQFEISEDDDGYLIITKNDITNGYLKSTIFLAPVQNNKIVIQ